MTDYIPQWLQNFANEVGAVIHTDVSIQMPEINYTVSTNAENSQGNENASSKTE